MNPWLLSDAFLEFEQEEKEREALEEGENSSSAQSNNIKSIELKNDKKSDANSRLLKEVHNIL